jgi:hypothetical protein
MHTKLTNLSVTGASLTSVSAYMFSLSDAIKSKILSI